MDAKCLKESREEIKEVRAISILWGLAAYLLGFIGAFTILPLLLLGVVPTLDSPLTAVIALITSFIYFSIFTILTMFSLVLVLISAMAGRNIAVPIGLLLGGFNAFIFLSWIISVYP